MSGLSPANAALVNADADLAAAAKHNGFTSAVALTTAGLSQTALNRLLDAARAAGPVVDPQPIDRLSKVEQDAWREHFRRIDDAIRIMRPLVDSYRRAVGRPRVITSHDGEGLVLISPRGSGLRLSAEAILLNPLTERVAALTWAFKVLDEKDKFGGYMYERRAPPSMPSAPAGPVVHIHQIGGNCPVQAEGTIDGEPFYFRARGQRWSIGIGGDTVMEPDWGYEESYGADRFAAGWMEVAEARAFIAAAALKFHTERHPS